jgi:cobalt-zinc-cadmium efflux system membrane fusion protein
VIEHDSTVSPLPTVPALRRHVQLQIIASVGLAILLIGLAAIGIKALLTANTPVPPPVPPGAFRPTQDQLSQLTIEPASSGANAGTLSATGSITADADHSTPILLPFSGLVREVMVEAGQSVSRGQPLLRIASPELVDARNGLISASAQQAASGEALRIAKATAERQKAIYETAGGALQDYLRAQGDLMAAQSSSRTANSAVTAARERLAIFGATDGETRALERDGDRNSPTATVFRAPVSGLIVDRNVAPGQFVAAATSTPLMTITNPAHVWLVAQLPESEAAEVRLGDQVVVTTPALPGRQFSATIDNIGAALDPVTHRLAVRATVRNPDAMLKPQMFASFAIRRRLSGTGGVLVPARAIIREGEAARVWVLGRDGLLYGRGVQLGDTVGGVTRVVRGLNVGDRVVTSGALFVNEAGLDQ